MVAGLRQTSWEVRILAPEEVRQPRFNSSTGRSEPETQCPRGFVILSWPEELQINSQKSLEALLKYKQMCDYPHISPQEEAL